MKVSFSREYVNENSMLGLLNSHFVRLMVRPHWFLQLRHDVVTNIFTLENLCGRVDSKTEPLIRYNPTCVENVVMYLHYG